MTGPRPAGAIGYVRVSLMREDAVSPEIQRASISGHAARNGRTVAAWVTDLDASGRNFRRKVMDAIGRVENGDASEIIVYRFDRWGRNAVEALANIARVEKAGGRVISATEPVDPEKAFGKFTRTHSLALAELQSDVIGEGWAAAHARRVSTGLPANGTPRFGYRRMGRVPDPVRAHVFRRDMADPAGERYEPDPVTGPVLRNLYLDFTAGTGTTRLLAGLNGAGITTVRGASWSANALLRVLDSGFGAGLLSRHDPACRCGKPQCSRRAWAKGTHEPVITGDEWDAYRQARQDRARMAPRSRDPAYPLSGLVRCGTCGGPCTAAFSNGQRGYGYRCANRVQHRGCPGVFARRADVEAAVLAQLDEWAGTAAATAAVTSSRASAAASAERLAARHSAALAKADRELTRLLLRSAADEGIPPEVWEAAKAELLAARDKAASALAGAQRSATVNQGDFLPLILALSAEWDLLDAGTRRAMASRLISKVTLTRTGKRTPALIGVVPVWASP